MSKAAARHSTESPALEKPEGRIVHLMREIRFSIDRDWARAAHGSEGFEGALPVTNSWGGWPSAVGVAPYLVLRIVVSGRTDPVTGYQVNIQTLDRLLRQYAIPLAARRLSERGVRLTGERLLRDIWNEVSAHVGVRQSLAVSRQPSAVSFHPSSFILHPSDCSSLESLTLWTTPYLSYGIIAGADAMVELTQCFEFSASHRLNVAELSSEENQRVFGKCNNPKGHGHNYRVEVTLAGEVSPRTGRVIPLPEFEAIVKREVIDRFDHKHLNEDTAEFAALNPSVENISRTIWALLVSKVAPARLKRVRVWETAKTYAEYSES